MTTHVPDSKQSGHRQSSLPRTESIDVIARQKEQERQKRLEAIDLIFGMWKNRTDIPQDGLAFQEELRAEW
ncbi:hypothetical protein GTP45_00970 [Pseudoduganella sp. FT55W]|uniref:Uncharacterized protein n=1 Tax=Duganella rivi TaxID=2666083 RepID=A0A7X4GLU4_9BURK|nr:hypothetical protein [Duganella rivi]MYM65404.1 hypothetical protein [Duganella rivi]